MNEMPKPTHHRRGGRRASTMELILSVTDAKVYPGPMRPAPSGAAAGRSSVGSSSGGITLVLGELGDFGVRVLECRQVGGPRPCVQVPQQFVVQRLGAQAGHLADRPALSVALVQVAEGDGPGRARGLAGGDHVAVA